MSEAIDYIDLRLTKAQQTQQDVEAAREALYRAEDTGTESDASAASVKVANALLVMEIARS